MESFPELRTDRLKLRRIQVEDIPYLLKYASNKKISDYILNSPYPYQEPDAVFRISYVLQGFKNKLRYVFAITLNNEFIGEISLHLDNSKVAQLGYWVAEPFWNKGIATETTAAILKFGFEELQLDKIYATCHEENAASLKVVEHNGMKPGNPNGGVVQYQLTNADYQQMNGAHG